MRLAGTCSRYSKSAMPQLTTATTYHEDPVLKYFRWPYQAIVMNRLDPMSSRMVCQDRGMEASGFMRGLSETAEPELIALLHADPHLIALEKPAGLLSVPGRGADKQDCLSARAQRVFADALVVHRLDMATSGLFLMARGEAMQRALSMAFAGREVSKR